ncbi:MAG: ribosome biogenesis GTP-binding protein YihA/YsxC [Buchnera aphidicola (Floraphis choui)]
MFKKKYYNTTFLKSIANIEVEKYEFGSEVAFIGYSNSGKSTVINIVTNQKKLSRVSKIPGRTQLINVFEVSPEIRLVDLPGYGYSKVPEKVKFNLKNMVFKYLKIQKCLRGLVLLMDIRNSTIKYLDKLVVSLAQSYNIPILILLSKADKISFLKQKKQLNIIRQDKLVMLHNIQVELFSSFKKIGVRILKNQLDNWMCKKHYHT